MQDFLFALQAGITLGFFSAAAASVGAGVIITLHPKGGKRSGMLFVAAGILCLLLGYMVFSLGNPA